MTKLLARTILWAHVHLCRKCRYGLSLIEEEDFLRWLDVLSQDIPSEGPVQP